MDRVGFPSFNQYSNPPSNLLAGSFPTENRDVVLLGGLAYRAGTVLGKVTSGANKGKVTIATLNNGATPPVDTADGSQVPVGVLEFDVDATGGDQNASMYVAGDFDGAQLVLGAGFTLDNVQDAFGARPIFVKHVLPTY